DNTVRLWDRQGNPIGEPFEGHTDYVSSVAMSPDGNTIVSGSGDNTVRLWDRQGNPIGEPFEGHTGQVSSVAMSPDGNTIVSGSWDNTVRLWDWQGNPIGEPFEGHTSFVSSVAMSPDGNTIVSGSVDNTVRLWPASWNVWLEIACNRLRYHPLLMETQDPDFTEIANDARNACAPTWSLSAEESSWPP
ncbi:MAG: WD40 repeat domain-containing protein, partial [Cyanobacteria bacterium P01_F01_bin.53]